MKLIAISLLAVLALFATGSKKVYVDRMSGLEPFVEDALRAAELPFEFIEEQQQPALKAALKKRFPGVYAEVLYHKQTGRSDFWVLELRDVGKKKVVAEYSFSLPTDDVGRRRAAANFASAVKKALAGAR